MNDIIPDIKYKDELLAPITKGDIVGSIKYKVDDIEYSANLIAASNVEVKPNYTWLILLITGFLLIVISGRLYRKTNKTKKSRRR